MILAAHKMSKIVVDVSYTFSFFSLFPPYGQSYKSWFFFSAKQTYSGFFQKPPNQKQTQPHWVTCENKSWWQGIQTIVNFTHEDFVFTKGPSFRASSTYKPVLCDRQSKQTNKQKTNHKKMNIFTIQFRKSRGLGGKRGNNRRDSIWVDRKTFKKTFYSLLL